jgi:hypothetical protein
VLGEDGWDVVIQRRADPAVYAGCLYSEDGAHYERIQSVDAGSVRIATDEGPVPIAFDPATMRVTRRVPAELCQTSP